MPKPNNNSIPVYRNDGVLWDVVTQHGIARLESAGRVARIVRRRKGHVNRAILFGRPDDARRLPTHAYAGRKYSFRERLEHGLAWELKCLGGRRDGKTYAPSEVRAMFLQVVRERLR